MNKVTKEQIDLLLSEADIQVTHRVFGKTCIVAVRLRNGFTIIETSSCIDPANYDEALGYKYAMENVADKLWEFEGYALQKSIAGEL